LPRRVEAIPQPFVVAVMAVVAVAAVVFCVAGAVEVVRALVGAVLVVGEGTELGGGLEGASGGVDPMLSVGRTRGDALSGVANADVRATVGTARGAAHPAPRTRPRTTA
jgi:hypothetical protein